MKFICFKEVIEDIGLIVITIIIAFLVYVQVNTEENEESATNDLIEERLSQQENYIYQIKVNVENLCERIEQIEINNKR